MTDTAYDLAPLRAAARDTAADAAGLDAEERRILLAHGTERPGCGLLLHNHDDGLYACRLCGLPLFESTSKFESGTGWPSFFQPVHPAHVTEIEDRTFGMRRVETRCARCDGHLGHVFPDGPPPTGQRYCMNSAALAFYPPGQTPVQRTAAHPEGEPAAG